jgi:hypothetical protein
VAAATASAPADGSDDGECDAFAFAGLEVVDEEDEEEKEEEIQSDAVADVVDGGGGGGRSWAAVSTAPGDSPFSMHKE